MKTATEMTVEEFAAYLQELNRRTLAVTRPSLANRDRRQDDTHWFKRATWYGGVSKLWTR